MADNSNKVKDIIEKELGVEREKLTNEDVEKDADAYIRFLDTLKQVNRRKGAGVQGYCFSGPFAFKTAALRSDRIRAVGSFHGGGLVTDRPNSPHLLAPKVKARMYFGVASSDDQRQRDRIDAENQRPFLGDDVEQPVDPVGVRGGPPDSGGPRRRAGRGAAGLGPWPVTRQKQRV